MGCRAEFSSHFFKSMLISEMHILGLNDMIEQGKLKSLQLADWASEFNVYRTKILKKTGKALR
jgi:hypothetical protein